MNEHVALRTSIDASYQVDIAAWSSEQARLLAQRRFDLIDLPNIIEEIQSLGNEQAHSIESHIAVAAEHLVKLLVSSDREPRLGWRRSVVNARNGIERRLRKNPSLRRELATMFTEAWPAARAAARSGLRPNEVGRVSDEPPFALEQLLDPNFLPEA